MSCYDIVLSRWGWALTSNVAPKVHEICKKRKKECFCDFCCSLWMVCFFPRSHQAPLHLQRARCCRKDQRPSSRKSNVVFVLPALCGVKNSQSTCEPTWKVGYIIQRRKSKPCICILFLLLAVKVIRCKIICRGIHHHFPMQDCCPRVFLPVNAPFSRIIRCVYLNFGPSVAPFFDWIKS